MWQWSSHVPTLSGTMSATALIIGVSMTMSIRMWLTTTVWPVPTGGVDVEGFFFVRVREQIPAHTLAVAHGHERAVRVHVAVDGTEVVEDVDVGVGVVVILGIAIQPAQVRVPVPAQMLVGEGELHDELAV